MTWEQPPNAGRRTRRWWLVAGLVGAVAAVSAVAIIMRSDAGGPADDLAVHRSEPPVVSSEQADVPDVAPTPLPPLALRTPEATGRPLPDAAGLTLVVATFDVVRMLDLGTGALREVNVAEQPVPVFESPSLFAVGEDLVADDGRGTVRLTSTGRLERLVRDHRPLLTFADDTVWVEANRSRGARDAWQLQFDGGVVDHVALPAAAQVHAGTADGLVISAAGNLYVATGAGTRRLTASGAFIAAGAGGELAWLGCGDDLTCELVIGTLDDPDQHRLRVAVDELPAHRLMGDQARFSPDGRWLALPLYTLRADGPAVMATAIVDVAAGTEVARLDAPNFGMFQFNPVTWSPDSRWLFTGVRNEMAAWDARSGDIHRLGVDNSQTFALAAYGG